MSDAFSSRFQPLDDFRKARMRKPSGQPYAWRSLDRLIRNGEIPIVKVGAVPFVDLDRLAEQMHHQRPRNKRRVVLRGE